MRNFAKGDLKMKVKELIKELEQKEPNAQVVIVCEADKNTAVIEVASSVCINGDCVQINGDSFERELK
jgi:hypothetical protein